CLSVAPRRAIAIHPQHLESFLLTRPELLQPARGVRFCRHFGRFLPASRHGLILVHSFRLRLPGALLQAMDNGNAATTPDEAEKQQVLDELKAIDVAMQRLKLLHIKARRY
ncbi:hypothetical protein BBK36DRAFT_1135703, partial [Trichoderma citrinoviride]